MVDGTTYYNSKLVELWNKIGEGGLCPRCQTGVIGPDWFGPSCEKCNREFMEVVHGCRCKGLNLCPECQAAGATEATRGEIMCHPDCSSMCPICCQDD